MARLVKNEKMSNEVRSRRPSFKTRGDRRTAVRAVRVTVPSNSVNALATKFNAVVVEDEVKGRAILKKLHSGQGNVRELKRMFESLQCPKVVLIRKNHGDEPSKNEESKTIKPQIHPKPNLSRKLNGNYVRKDIKELLGKEKKFSIPKTHILDEVLNENSKLNIPKIIKPNSSFLWGSKDNQIEETTRDAETNLPRVKEGIINESETNLTRLEKDLSNESETNLTRLEKDLSNESETNLTRLEEDLRNESETNLTRLEDDLSDKSETNLTRIEEELSNSKAKREEQTITKSENLYENEIPIQELLSRLKQLEESQGMDNSDSLSKTLLELWDSKITPKEILKNEIDQEKHKNLKENNDLGKPNNSFLWGLKQINDEHKKETPNIKTIDSVDKIIQENLIKENDVQLKIDKKNGLIQNKKETNRVSAYVGIIEKILEKRNDMKTPQNEIKDFLIDDKENVEKLETPVERVIDKKGYGKINVQANSSSLYRNILKRSLLDEIKEKIENREKTEVLKEKREENVKYNKEGLIFHGNSLERTYETVEQNSYEVVSYGSNTYDVIRDYDDEAIYDDVLNVTSERVYESIYNLGRLQGDSDSCCDQSNSLYDARPPSRASSGSCAVASGTSRSDTSDDWVDIELDSSEEQKEQIVVLQGVHRTKSGMGWSQKVRRQWSTRSITIQKGKIYLCNYRTSGNGRTIIVEVNERNIIILNKINPISMSPFFL